MNSGLKHDLMRSLFRFKKICAAISRTVSNVPDEDISLFELSALGCIASCSKEELAAAEHTTHHAIHEDLSISKAAVSQMLGSLEKKGYIQRDINRDNRRKINITLTSKGKTIIDKADKNMGDLMTHVIARFGIDDTKDFMRLLDRFTEIVNDIAG
jgi:DNA-binding MarR family transcriptional regulator